MYKTVLIVVIVLTFVGCTHEEVVPRDYPVVSTRGVTDISNGSALLQAEITFTPGAIIDHGFIWNRFRFPTLTDPDSEIKSLGSRTEAGTFQFTIPGGLVVGKKYDVCAYAKSSKDIVYGKTITFVAK